MTAAQALTSLDRLAKRLPDDFREKWGDITVYLNVLARVSEYENSDYYSDLRTTSSLEKIRHGLENIKNYCIRLESTFKESEPVRKKNFNPNQSFVNGFAKIGMMIDNLNTALIAAGVHPRLSQAAKLFQDCTVTLETYKPLLRDLTLVAAKNTLASEFERPKKELDTQTFYWQCAGISGLVLLVVAALGAGPVAKCLGYDNVWYARLSISTPLIALTLYSFSQAANRRYLARQYEYRESVAKVLSAFSKVIEGAPTDESRSFLKEVSMLLFTPPSFSKGRTPVEQSLKSVQGVIDSVQKLAHPKAES